MNQVVKRKEVNENSIVIGCNYHTTWQSNGRMRFILKEVNGDKARLITRNTRKDFWCKVTDLKLIMSNHNIQKAIKIINERELETPTFVR